MGPKNVPRPVAPAEPAPMTEREFLEYAFHELSQPVSALWCALEVAATRPPSAEEDRQDLMAVFNLVEGLGRRLRDLQTEAEDRLAQAEPAGEQLSKV